MSKIHLLEAKGINLKNKQSGSIKVVCPECSESRRNKTDLCLSVNIDEGVYNCHHCGWSGGVFEKIKKEYLLPSKRLEKLTQPVIEWFETKRGISNNTLLRLSITETIEWMPQHQKEVRAICFNYYRGDNLVNIKFRGPDKAFKLSKDSELILYNLNCLEGEKTAVIVEGEIDCLSMYEAGIFNCVSVPNGASKGNQKLEYLDNCWEYFKGIDKIILCVDNDDAGYSLREELARRLGVERCYKVVYPDGCKDANEVLLQGGKDSVKALVENAVPFPIEGILTMDELFEDVVNFYKNGYPNGTKIGIDGLDDFMQLMPGQFTTVTGIPGSGKSEFCDYMMAKTAMISNWSWGVCSFENQPSSLHATKIIEKLMGKAFEFRKDASNRLSVDEFENGIGLVDKYFHFINISTVDLTLTGLLKKAAELVVRKGIKGLLIDPWNYIEHKIPKGYSETQYVSESLTEVKTFCMKYGVHVLLIAHPIKTPKDKQTGKFEVPNLYSISGSAHFFNKTDNGISVYRHFDNNVVDIHVQKIRYSWLGKVGFCSFNYNTYTRQYSAI